MTAQEPKGPAEDAKRLEDIKRAIRNTSYPDHQYYDQGCDNENALWLISQAEKLAFSQGQEEQTGLMLEDAFSRLADMQAVLHGTDIKLGIAEEALEKIANQDYRGNRTNESVLAFNALKKIKEKR